MDVLAENVLCHRKQQCVDLAKTVILFLVDLLKNSKILKQKIERKMLQLVTPPKSVPYISNRPTYVFNAYSV